MFFNRIKIMEAKVIVCTGGIGSGKSYVIRVFNAVGVPSYDSDSRAKALYDNDRQLLDSLIKVAGEDVIDSNGKLSRSLLAKKIFTDREMIFRIEAIVHPAVIRDFERWKAEQNAKIVIFESAIFLEKPMLASIADYVLVVTAPIETRISRVMLRDNLSRQNVLHRLSNQWNDEQRMSKADFVIHTNDKDPILPQVTRIIREVENGIR